MILAILVQLQVYIAIKQVILEQGKYILNIKS